MSQRRWAVRLFGWSLRGTQLAGRRLVLDTPLWEAAVREGLPSDLPQLRAGRHVHFVQHGASVVPNLVAITDTQTRGTGRRNNVLAIRTPGEMCGVRSLRFGHLKKRSVLKREDIQFG